MFSNVAPIDCDWNELVNGQTGVPCPRYGLETVPPKMINSGSRDAVIVERLFRLTLLVLATWLVWAVTAVNIDFDDGYAAFANSTHFLGQSPVHFYNRAPLLGIMLMPVKLLSDAIGLHPLDVRGAHALMALILIAYLVGTWRILARAQGCTPWSLVAFAAAMPTPVFFSYAPFLNIDIFPGAMALWMLVLVDRQLSEPRASRWWALVALGALLPLIKQTYALVWIGILVVGVLLAPIHRAHPGYLRALSRLVLAAAVSGAITWFAYGALLATPFGAEPIWWRPWLQIQAISKIYDIEGGAWQVFDPWTYLRNLSAYGIVAMALVLPGAAVAIVRGSSLERQVALFWLFLVAVLHLTPYKEVRYFAFLAPLNAMLLAVILRHIWQGSRILRGGVIAALGLSVALAVPEAARLRDSYYRQSVFEFLDPLPIAGRLPGRVIFGDPLSFVSPEGHAFFADQYHRITHLMPEAIIALYGYPADSAWQIKSTADVRAHLVRPGDVWLLTSSLLIRQKPFVRGNLQGLDQNFFQLVAVAVPLDLERGPDGYVMRGPHSRSSFLLVGVGAESGPMIATGAVDEADAIRLFGWQEPPVSAQVVAFRILQQCSLDGCARSD